MATLQNRMTYEWIKSAANLTGLPQEVYKTKQGSYIYASRNLLSILSIYATTREGEFLGFIYPEYYNGERLQELT